MEKKNNNNEGFNSNVPPQSSSSPLPSCPADCPYKTTQGCLAIDGIGLLEHGYILEGVSILSNLVNECVIGDNYFFYHLWDPENKFPDSTPQVQFAMGLTHLYNGIDFEDCYGWIKNSADLGCLEAKNFLKHFKRK